MYAEEEKKFKKNLTIIIITMILTFILIIFYLLNFNNKNKISSNDFEKKILNDVRNYVSLKNINNHTFISLADIEKEIGSSYSTCNKSTGIDYNNGKFDLYVICSKYISENIKKISETNYDNITLKEDSFLITNNKNYIEPGFVSNYKVETSGIRNYDKPGLYLNYYYVKDKNGNLLETANRYILYSDFNNDLAEVKMILNGDKEIYLKGNDTFKDPGVYFVNNTGKKLNYNAVTSGKVYSNIPGEYTITYTLNQLSLSRKVIVTNLEYNAYLSNSNPTNSSIKIIVDVGSDEFQRMELPDRTSITQPHYEYEVFENRTYKFYILTKNIGKIEIVKEVTNIDKIKPKVSCSGKAENNITTINVEAQDDSGIKNYKYGNFSGDIQNNSYVIKSMISSLIVTVTDNASNKTEQSCNIEVKAKEPETINISHDPMSGNKLKVRLTRFDDDELAKCDIKCVQKKIANGELKTDERGWYMYKYNDKWYYVVATAINNKDVINKYGHQTYTDIRYYNYYDTFKIYISDKGVTDSRYLSYDVIVLDVCGACLKFSKNYNSAFHPNISLNSGAAYKREALLANSIKIDLWTSKEGIDADDWAYLDS